MFELEQFSSVTDNNLILTSRYRTDTTEAGIKSLYLEPRVIEDDLPFKPEVGQNIARCA